MRDLKRDMSDQSSSSSSWIGKSGLTFGILSWILHLVFLTSFAINWHWIEGYSPLYAISVPLLSFLGFLLSIIQWRKEYYRWNKASMILSAFSFAVIIVLFLISSTSYSL